MIDDHVSPVTKMPTALPVALASVLLFAFPAMGGRGDVHGNWLQWGGPNRDFKVDATGLADEWPDDGPRKIWHRKLGTGYSAIVSDGAVLYTMYRTRKRDAYEYTIALDAAARAHAWLNNQDFVSPDNIRAVAPACLAHRVHLTYEAEAAGVTRTDAIEELLRMVVPV